MKEEIYERLQYITVSEIGYGYLKGLLTQLLIIKLPQMRGFRALGVRMDASLLWPVKVSFFVKDEEII